MKYFLTGLFFLLSSVHSSANQTLLKGEDPYQEIKKNISRLVNGSKVPTSDLGMIVTTTFNGEDYVLYQLNESKGFIPASLSKIPTALAVLDLLPMDFRFLTRLASSGRVEGDHLVGDLYIKGGGDAGFVSESLWFLVNEFHRTGIRQIEGDLIADDSRFDDQRFDSSRQMNRVDRAYDAPVGALSFNWNSVNVYVRPGEKRGAPAKVWIDPENNYIELVNRTKTVAGEVKGIEVSREEGKTASKDRIVVSGNIGEGREEIVIYKGVSDPVEWTLANLRNFLKQRGIQVKGQNKRGKAPSAAKILAEAKSRPLSSHVADMMKFSNNYVAEMLTKNLAAEKAGEPGSVKKGVEIIGEYLKSKGLKSQDFTFENPSGLTNSNKFRPQDLNKLLIEAHSSFLVFPEFASALPIGGIDGTLKRRMGSAEGKSFIRAKTGLLTGAVGLAGYSGRSDGTLFTFVFIFNGTPSKADSVRQLFDQVVLKLAGD